jgi:hypothetical protein
MKVYKLNFKLHNARPLDYERLHRELKTELFSKLHKLDLATKYDPERWVEYLYQGSGSLPEVTAAAYRAARNLGKDYSFTIIKQKGDLKVITFENELLQHPA